ncbi:MAG TPA: ABC transporter substrate-binding protein [Thermodesulfobacteriota bacterium]|nr:ABC transporter substrate-binding protein [Thermodesulfobacteriota bacterium]
MKKLISFVIIGALLQIGLGSASAEEAKVINFGLLKAISGPAAVWGIPNSRSISMGAEKINDQGGFKVKGQTYKWNPIVYDHKYVPAEAVKAANKAIYGDKCMFLSIMGGSITLASIPLMKENKILSVNDAGGGKAVTNPDNPLVFRYNPSIEAAYARFLPYLMKQEGVKTMAVLNPDDETGRSGLDAVKSIAQFDNLKIIGTEFYERGIKEFTPILVRVIAKNPDMIDTSYSDPTSCALINKQARELGYKGAILLLWGPNPKDVISIGGANAEKAWMGVSGPLEPQTPEQKEFYNRFLKKWSASQWDSNYWTHSEQIPCITKAIVETQSFDPFVLAKHMETMTWDSPLGPMRVGGSKLFGIKRQVIFPSTLYRVEGGKPVLKVIITDVPEFLD